MLIFPLGALHNQLGLLNCVHLIDWVEEVDPGSEDVHDVSGGSTMMKSLLSVAAVWGLSAMVWAADPPAGSPAPAPSPKPAASASGAHGTDSGDHNHTSTAIRSAGPDS